MKFLGRRLRLVPLFFAHKVRQGRTNSHRYLLRMGSTPRFFPSESVRRAEVAVIDAIAGICAEHDLAYQLVPTDSGSPNTVSFRLEVYPDPGVPAEQLMMRRTYHWLCRAHGLPYDLPGRWFKRAGGVMHRFLGASLETPLRQREHFFIASTPGGEQVRMTADEVRAQVVPPEEGDGNIHVHAGLGILLPKHAPRQRANATAVS